MKKNNITLKIDDKDKEKLEFLAKQQNKTFSEYVRELIQIGLDKNDLSNHFSEINLNLILVIL